MAHGISRITPPAAALMAVAALLTGGVWVTAHAQSNNRAGDQPYSERIRQSYNFLFGKDNFSLPGNAATENNQFIQAGAFPTAEYFDPHEGHRVLAALRQLPQSDCGGLGRTDKRLASRSFV